MLSVLKKISIVACATNLLVSCGAGFGDIGKDLGNGYSYRAEGSNRWIMADNIFKQSIYAKILHFSYNDSFILASQQPSVEMYKTYLASDLRFKFTYFLEQKVISNVTQNEAKFLNSNFWKDSSLHNKLRRALPLNTLENTDYLNAIVDSVINMDPYYRNILSRKLNYWIIRKHDDSISGPLTRSEFEKNCQAFSIPAKLYQEIK